MGVGVAALAALASCKRDVRLAGHDLRDVEVKTVEHYGKTLDQGASPEEVTYVLLRAIQDDYLASAPADPTVREAALDKQFDVCAADTIAGRAAGPLAREEAIYAAVYRWTPAVSHYANGFETDWDRARDRFHRVGPRPVDGLNGVSACTILMKLDDPGGDANGGVLMAVVLIQENEFWRVVRLEWIPRRTVATAARP